MPSKKPASAKRAGLPRRFNIDKQFRKDWERLTRSGRFDMVRLKQAMMLLIGNEPFGAEWLDHPLTHGCRLGRRPRGRLRRDRSEESRRQRDILGSRATGRDLFE